MRKKCNHKFADKEVNMKPISYPHIKCILESKKRCYCIADFVASIKEHQKVTRIKANKMLNEATDKMIGLFEESDL